MEMPGRVAYYLCSYWPIDPDPHLGYWGMPTKHRLTERPKRILSRLVFRQLKRQGYPPKLGFEHAACVSEYLRGVLVKAGKLPEKAVVLHNGINPAPFLQPGSRGERKNPGIRLLYFGRLVPEKGVHTAIEALGLLVREKLPKKISLTVLGNGHPSYEAELRKKVEESGIQHLVTFVDQVPREETPKMISEHDICLFTSVWAEPLARSVMEAMAAGLLVIGTTVGGQSEMLLHGRNSLTYSAGDSTGLAKRIAYVCRHESVGLRLAREGQRTVLEDFSLDSTICRIESLLHGVLEQSKRLKHRID
jgi:glycosyltransferase involved in cell wall biosynthesis